MMTENINLDILSCPASVVSFIEGQRIEIGHYRAALERCAGPFRIGDENGLTSLEKIAREFSRRQQIAARGLGWVGS